MKRIEWQTQAGTAIDVTLSATETSWSDGWEVEIPCWRLHCRVNTTPLLMLYDVTIEPHETAGHVLRGERKLVPIAPEVLADVTAMVDEYWAEIARRNEKTMLADREYDAHCASMSRAMEE